jgi:hypothetical protein
MLDFTSVEIKYLHALLWSRIKTVSSRYNGVGWGPLYSHCSVLGSRLLCNYCSVLALRPHFSHFNAIGLRFLSSHYNSLGSGPNTAVGIGSAPNVAIIMVWYRSPSTRCNGTGTGPICSCCNGPVSRTQYSMTVASDRGLFYRHYNCLGSRPLCIHYNDLGLRPLILFL